MEKINAINTYTCEICGGVIVTVNRADGVTPAFLACRAPRLEDEDARPCDGTMASAWYRVSQSLTPTHEWYRPKDLTGFTPAQREHIENGGLVLRLIAATAETQQ